MRRYCATAILLWVMWEYSAILQNGPQNETWYHLDAYYLKWSCKLASYRQARSFAENPGGRQLDWNSVHMDWPSGPSELHEFICVPDVLDPRLKTKQ